MFSIPDKGGKEERGRTRFWFWRRQFRAHRQMGHGALIRPRPNLFLSTSRFRPAAGSAWRKAGSGRALSLGTRSDENVHKYVRRHLARERAMPMPLTRAPNAG